MMTFDFTPLLSSGCQTYFANADDGGGKELRQPAILASDSDKRPDVVDLGKVDASPVAEVEHPGQ